MAHQDKLDHHRCNDSDAQDPTSMTIEFLRARLLAERAVSKSARAKLDGLADKVAELEEQLKIASLQRKKAEQATADVLAILAENGFNDVSDGYDSTSDQESYSQASSVSGKSLSWKGRRREAASSDKAKEPRDRRQRGFDSAYIWRPRHRQGRSCRQIKRSESRTVSEDHKGDGNAIVDTEVVPNASEESSRTVVDVVVMKGDESLQNVLEKRDSMDINLERALAKRAQVIGSFEDMEETQKQWEKEFTDSKLSALDSCDVGNHSDVTDESNGEKTQTQVQDSTLVANEADQGSPDHSVTSSSDKCCKSCGTKSMEQDAFPSGDKGKQIPESPKSESSHSQSSQGISQHSSSTIQPNSRGSSFRSNATTTFQKVDYPLVPASKEKSDNCETVLTALQQAKLSLQEKVNSLHTRKPEYQSESSYPSTPGSYALSIEAAPGSKSSLPASNTGSMVEFPVGCAGLFRVPTDFSPDASTKNSILASSSTQKALISHTPDTSPPLSTDERPLITPYIGGLKLYAGFREDTQESRHYKATPSVSGSVISGFGGNQLSFSTSLNLDRQVSTYTHVTPTRSLYPDSVLRSREMYSTPYYTRAVGLPPSGGGSGPADGLFRRV
ncbi:uncharacterized protein BNAC08G23550D [Brassica napus]|uniref:Uncharacterized protein n=3 Tax=Brassica TaxID=3705 RepID=A0A0D3DS78_BRAOL|nr:PREDICTED: uncharacterized protein LOC106311712 [Brassica oleracea var. oleracea]XP_013663147.1 uncharacterized protein BNAC08G23550D [Brassica napus]CAF2111222.1 unnamed protein product [Brassica napus]VDD57136.1 unnamed protein product [Brassica oleracea]